MTYQFGKAVMGGTPIGPDDVRRIAVSHLERLKSLYSRPLPEATDDLLDLRIAEELDHVKRMLEMIEAEVGRRVPNAAAPLASAETIIGDLAAIVQAKDRCEALAGTTPDLKRRLSRRTDDGATTVCDNR